MAAEFVQQSLVAGALEQGVVFVLCVLAFRRGVIVFLVSDFLCRGWERPLTLCARRHDVVAVRIRVPELAPPDAGLLRVRDPETGLMTVIDWGSRRVRAEYAGADRAKAFAKLKLFLPGATEPPPYEKVAAELGCSVAALNSEVHRLRQRFSRIQFVRSTCYFGGRGC